MRLPTQPGLWPAFWMMGEDLGRVGWPRSGEIDVMELVGDEPGKVWASAHGPGYIRAGLTAPFDLPHGQTFSDEFHTFGVELSGDELAFDVDGTVYHRVHRRDIGADKVWVFDRSTSSSTSPSAANGPDHRRRARSCPRGWSSTTSRSTADGQAAADHTERPAAPTVAGIACAGSGSSPVRSAHVGAIRLAAWRAAKIAKPPSTSQKGSVCGPSGKSRGSTEAVAGVATLIPRAPALWYIEITKLSVVG